MSKKTKNQRNKTVSIKVSEDEFALINLYASQKPHVSVSDYVRDKALKQTVKPLQVTEEDLKKLKEFTEKKKTVEKQKESNQEALSDRIEITQKELKAINDLIDLYDETGYMNFNKFNNNKTHYINIKRAFNDLIIHNKKD